MPRIGISSTRLCVLFVCVIAWIAPREAAAQASPFTSFFATSAGNGSQGGNHGGLAGADATCQGLAASAGVGDRTWRAYLSTAPIAGVGGALVHARDRIGDGPWYDYDGELVAGDVDGLHADGIPPAQILTELGSLVPSSEHDILTGSDTDGTALPFFPGNPASPPPTCLNWTSNDAGSFTWIGHSDWDPGDSWNSSHGTQCDQAGLASTLSAARLYCFATDAPIPAPDNDACNDATVIPGGGPFPAGEDIDTTAATGDPGDPTSSCSPPGADASVWYSFTPAFDGTATVRTDGSDYPAVVSVWAGAPGCGALSTEIACDDAGGSGDAEATFPVSAGALYRVKVADRSGAGGGSLSVEFSLVTSGASPLMTFFATSIGNGVNGGDYGGLVGADARCESLAATAGRGQGTWRAYLSTAPIDGFGGALVNARDRIGSGPWANYDGDEVSATLAALHADGLDPALVVDEFGSPVPSIEHDILTGSLPDGSAREEFPGNPFAPAPNCFNWTTNDPGAFTWVGHSDDENGWSSSHETTCDESGLAATAGSGRLYCFRVEPAPEPGALASLAAVLLALGSLGRLRFRAAQPAGPGSRDAGASITPRGPRGT